MVVFLLLILIIPRIFNSKQALVNISILKQNPLYLSKISETIFLLYRRRFRIKKKIRKQFELEQGCSMFISFFEKKIKEEKFHVSLYILWGFSHLLYMFNGEEIVINYVLIIKLVVLGILIIFNINITKNTKSWLNYYSNLYQGKNEISNYEIISNNTELNLLEKDFQQFETQLSRGEKKCPVCNTFNNHLADYCESCGSKFQNELGDFT